MKNIFILLILAVGFTAGAQNFEKYYPYLADGSGDIVFAYDDGYAMAGFSYKINIGSKLFVFRTNLSGDTLWTKSFKIEGGNYISCSARDENGNIFLSVSSADSADLIKFSPEWDILWMRRYDPSIEFKQMKLSADNNLLLLGDTRPPNALYSFTCLYKLNFDGNILWQSDTLSIHGGFELCPAIVELENNNIAIITNPTWFFEPPTSSTVYYLSNIGDSISTSPLLNLVLRDTYAVGNELLSVANEHYSSGDNKLIRFLPDGTILWQKQLDLPEKAEFWRFIPFANNKFIASGTTSPDFPERKRIILHGMSETGDSLWTNFIGSASDFWTGDIAVCGDNGFIITGLTYISGDQIPFLIKTDSTGNINNVGINNNATTDKIRVYPNPAKDYVIFESTNIKTGIISVSDIYGREVAEVPVTGGKTVWDTRGVRPGVYLYKVDLNKTTSSGKILIMR